MPPPFSDLPKAGWVASVPLSPSPLQPSLCLIHTHFAVQIIHFKRKKNAWQHVLIVCGSIFGLTGLFFLHHQEIYPLKNNIFSKRITAHCFSCSFLVAMQLVWPSLHCNSSQNALFQIIWTRPNLSFVVSNCNIQDAPLLARLYYLMYHHLIITNMYLKMIYDSFPCETGIRV